MAHSKTALDQDLARQMLPLLPPGKEPVWNSPSPLWQPGQTDPGRRRGLVFAAALLLFGAHRLWAPAPGQPHVCPRTGIGWAKSWIPGEAGERELVRRYLH